MLENGRVRDNKEGIDVVHVRQYKGDMEILKSRSGPRLFHGNMLANSQKCTFTMHPGTGKQKSVYHYWGMGKGRDPDVRASTRINSDKSSGAISMVDPFFTCIW